MNTHAIQHNVRTYAVRRLTPADKEFCEKNGKSSSYFLSAYLEEDDDTDVRASRIPTKHVTILEPRNRSIDISELHKICWYECSKIVKYLSRLYTSVVIVVLK